MLNLEGFLFDNNRQKRRNTNGEQGGIQKGGGTDV
jgi:hypothetical protein